MVCFIRECMGLTDGRQTRMQILHPSSGGLYTGLTNAFSTIYRIEGWRTLWKGVSSVIVGAGPAHAVYFGTYELVKDLAGGNVDQGHHPLAAGRFFDCASSGC